MGKRAVMAFVMAAVVLGAAACDGPYIPSGWKAPVVGAVVLDPAPVVAGQPFSVTVSATDDKQVKSISVRFLGPHPERWDTMSVPCQGPSFTPAPAVTKVFDCAMPAIAPNGIWTMAVTTCDGEVTCQQYGGLGGGGYKTTTFEVTGGTDDDDAPVIQSAVRDPDPVVAGAPFTLTLRITDDHLVTDAPAELATMIGTFQGGTTQYCAETARTLLSPTELEYTYGCPAPAVAGQYRVTLSTRDQMGSLTLWGPPFDVIAAP